MGKTIKKILQIILIASCLCVIIVLIAKRKFSIRTILQFAQDNPWELAALILFLYALKACCGIIMYTGLVAATSFAFPFWQAVLINSLGTIICFSISYCFGRMTDNSDIEARLHTYPKIEKHLANCRQNDFVLCFATHIGGLSSEVTGIFYGLMRMHYLLYLSSAFLGVAPGMICVTISGGIKNTHSFLFWALYGINFALAIVGLVILSYRLKNSKKAQTEKPAAEQMAEGKAITEK